MKLRSDPHRWRLASVVLLVGLCSCQAGAERPGKKGSADKEPDPSPKVKTMAKIKLVSPAFEAEAAIPKKYTGEGDDVSPPLEWSGLPEGTRELALICDDPDAPSPQPWVHWVLYKIPADSKGLPEGVETTARPKDPAGALNGRNSWPAGENLGYRGPMPPKGRHRYYFKLYALDEALEVEPGLTKSKLLEKLSGHVLGEGQLMGTYERK
jgi:Raf kinase inhibitor-like YbhB/YbcL family protein